MAMRTNNPPKPHLGFGTRVRKSPYFESTLKWGCKEYTTYNHMYFPVYYNTPEDDYWSLINDVTLWDVAVERQVEITGPDAAKFTQLLTPRNLADCEVYQCKYVLNTNYEGGILSDPILLKLAEDHWWYSISDSDLLLWAMGVAGKDQYDIKLVEPDVSPLQVQGPKSKNVMVDLFGSWINDLRYYWCKETELDGIPVVVSRTGWSGEIGYEVYLRDGSKGADLYEKIMTAGKNFGIQPGHTSSIRRIEGGMLSYHADADINTNPFELGLDRLVNLESDINFIGKDALRKIKNDGIKRKQVGIELDCEPLLGPNTTFWTIMNKSEKVGKVTSAVYSPRLKKNIALAMVDIKYTDLGTKLQTKIDDKIVNCTIVEKPFFDPKKKIASS